MYKKGSGNFGNTPGKFSQIIFINQEFASVIYQIYEFVHNKLPDFLKEKYYQLESAQDPNFELLEDVENYKNFKYFIFIRTKKGKKYGLIDVLNFDLKILVTDQVILDIITSYKDQIINNCKGKVGKIKNFDAFLDSKNKDFFAEFNK